MACVDRCHVLQRHVVTDNHNTGTRIRRDVHRAYGRYGVHVHGRGCQLEWIGWNDNICIQDYAFASAGESHACRCNCDKLHRSDMAERGRRRVIHSRFNTDNRHIHWRDCNVSAFHWIGERDELYIYGVVGECEWYERNVDDISIGAYASGSAGEHHTEQCNRFDSRSELDSGIQRDIIYDHDDAHNNNSQRIAAARNRSMGGSYRWFR